MRLGQTSVIHFGSRLVASVAGFVATLYIARVLGGSALGMYFLFVAVLIWLKTLFGSGIHYAIKKRLSEAGGGGEELGSGLAVQSVVYVAVAVGLVAFRETVNGYIGFEAVWLLVIALAAVLAFALVSATLHGEQKVHLAALLRPLNLVVRSGVQLGVVFLGLLGGGVVGLVWGYVAVVAVAAVAGVALLSIRPLWPGRESVRSVVEFTRYSWLSGIEERSFSALDTIVLGLFVTSNLVAYYEVAWNLASLLAIFGTSVTQTLFPTISELDSKGDRGEIGELITESLAYSGLFLVPGLVGTLFIGDVVLGVYGAEFQRATLVLPVLVAGRLIYAYEAQFVSLLNALDYPDVAFRVNLVFVAANVVLNLLLVWLYGWVGAAVATTTAALVGLALAFVAVSRVIDFAVPKRELGYQWVAAGVMAIAVYGARTLLTLSVTPIVDALAYVSVGAGVYFLALWALSDRFRGTVQDNLPI